MAFKDRVAQIVELLPTFAAVVALPLGLGIMKTSFVNGAGVACGTSDPFRLTQFSNHFKTFRIIYQVLDVDHFRILSDLITHFLHLLETGNWTLDKI
jgi:hypothetical protein